MFDEEGTRYLDCINNVAHGKYRMRIFYFPHLNLMPLLRCMLNIQFTFERRSLMRRYIQMKSDCMIYAVRYALRRFV